MGSYTLPPGSSHGSCYTAFPVRLGMQLQVLDLAMGSRFSSAFRFGYGSSSIAYQPLTLQRTCFRFRYAPAGLAFSSEPAREPVDLNFEHVLWPDADKEETKKCLALFRQTFDLSAKMLWWDIQNFVVKRMSIPATIQKIKNLAKEKNMRVLVFGAYYDMGDRLVKFLRDQGYAVIADRVTM